MRKGGRRRAGGDSRELREIARKLPGVAAVALKGSKLYAYIYPKKVDLARVDEAIV